MNESLNIEEQERMLAMLTEKLQSPENYTQEEIERIKLEMKALRNRRSALDSQRRGLKKQIKEIENNEPALIAERIELEEEYPDLEQALADVQTELINMPFGPSPEVATQRSNELQAKRDEIINQIENLDLRLAQISTELNLRSQKESRLAHLDVAVDKLNNEYELLAGQSDPATLPLDLVNNKVGRDRYLSDYERLDGLQAGLELRQKIQTAQDNNEPLLVYPQGIIPQIETTLEEIALAEPLPELLPELDPMIPVVEEPSLTATPASLNTESSSEEPSLDIDNPLEPAVMPLIEEASKEDEDMEEILLVDDVEELDEEERLTLWGRFKESSLGKKIVAVGLTAVLLMAMAAGWHNAKEQNNFVMEPPQDEPGIELANPETSNPETSVPDSSVSISDEDIARAMAGEEVAAQVNNSGSGRSTRTYVDTGDYTSYNNLMEEPNNAGTRDHNEDVGPGNDNQTPNPGDEQVGDTPTPPPYVEQPIPEPELPELPNTPPAPLPNPENEISFEDPISESQSFESSASVRVR